jgi:hypothetical protein
MSKILFNSPPGYTQELSVFFMEFLNSLTLLKRQQPRSSFREHKPNIKLLCSQKRKVQESTQSIEHAGHFAKLGKLYKNLK